MSWKKREDINLAAYDLSLPGGLTARFNTVSPLTAREKQLIAAHVPGVGFGSARSKASTLTVTQGVAAIPALYDGGDNVRFDLPPQDGLPMDMVFLLYGAVRRALLAKNLYCVHAACVGDTDGHVLIAGHSGAGKTTLTQALIDRHGMTLFSGNKTVVRFDGKGGLSAVAGTRTMTALDKGLNRYAYELPSEAYTKAKDVPVRRIALVRLNDGVEEAQDLQPLSAMHHLQSFFMDAVNADVVVGGGHILDGNAHKRVREELVRGLMGMEARVQKFAGGLDFLCRHVRP